ncbi:hypothetical protein [Natrinema altunense]|uniref:HEAT repeat domain-containing protein n=1 Tax=Natrinema altunense (strain JCM 12890 / CGMCC 1.3731 / AJ2) TaxID=1227494 RepID=L9ZSA3_NATA2|nr:hypothetical protein [Natrinema altunense]ELY88437.1 hypothetical protein C485_05750 [Natrinema altunense JCM 12890]
MPPSDDGPSLETLAARVAETPPADRRGPALELAKRRLETVLPSQSTALTDDTIDRLLPHLDDPDPAVRSAVLLVLRNAMYLQLQGTETALSEYPPEALADRLLERIDDEHWAVRQAVLVPRYLHPILAATFEDDADVDVDTDALSASASWLADRLFQRLVDPVPVIRKRTSALFFELEDASTVVLAHPDPDRAVTTLVETLTDPADTVFNRGDACEPRNAAIETLVELVAHRPGLILPHLETMLTHLTGDNGYLRFQIVKLSIGLLEQGEIGCEAIADDVIDALEHGCYPLRTAETMQLLVSVALTRPDVIDDVASTLRSELAANDSRRSYAQHAAAADALGRLVRESEQSFGSVEETVAERTGDQSLFDAGIDPLVPLAEDHPAFVADALTNGYEALREEDMYDGRFDKELLVSVADRNPAAAEPVLADLVDGANVHNVRRLLANVSEAHPTLVAEIVPDLLETVETTPPIPRTVCQVLATTAEIGVRIPDELVAAVTESVGPIGNTPAYNGNRRYWAVRALVTLSERNHDAVPERIEPFVEAYRDGQLDDVVDPLELPAAREAGWEPVADASER